MGFRLVTLSLALLGCHTAPVPVERQLAAHGRRAQSASELVALLKPIAEDPRVEQSLQALGTDPRIIAMVTLMLGPEVGDAMKGLATVDMNDLLTQTEMMLNALGDMDMSEVKDAVKKLTDGADPAALTDMFQGADLSQLASDVSNSMDLTELAASLDELDLDAMMSELDAPASLDGGMGEMQELMDAVNAKLESDPALKAYLNEFMHNLILLLTEHQHDNDGGAALEEDMAPFIEKALEEYQAVEEFNDEEIAILDDGFAALEEALTPLFGAVQDNVDMKQMAAWYAEYQVQHAKDEASAAISNQIENAKTWMWGEPEQKSVAELAIEQLIPTPPMMTPYQNKEFERVVAESVAKYESHPDFKDMTDAEIARWNAKIVSDAQEELSHFLTSPQLKQWASVAYHITG